MSNSRKTTASPSKMSVQRPSGLLCFVCCAEAKTKVISGQQEDYFIQVAVTECPIMVPTQDGIGLFVLPVCMDHLPAGPDRAPLAVAHGSLPK